MTDPVSSYLAHYGVKGMRWGQRKAVINEARKNSARTQVDLQDAKKNYDSQTSAAGKKAALKDLRDKEFANWENRQTASTLTRGEQVAIGILTSIGATPLTAIAVLGGAAAVTRDSKQFKSKYDNE